MTAQDEPLLPQFDQPNLSDSASGNLFTAALNQRLNLLHVEGLHRPLQMSDIQRLSPSVLAYIGDAVYEMYVRMFFLLPPQKLDVYHRLVVEQVCAEAQAMHLQQLLPHLLEGEIDIVRRGRNAANTKNRRANPEIYQQASSLESLIGYLYLTDARRLTELLQKLHFDS